MTVYLDLYFLANLLIDWLLLSAIGDPLPPPPLRRLLAALSGSLGACLSLCFCASAGLTALFSLPLAALMVRIAQPFGNRESFVRELLSLYGGSFFFSGLLPFLLRYLPLWLLSVALSYALLRLLRLIARRRRRQVLLQIVSGSERWSVPALIDSGNTLCDPVSALPVIVVHSASLPAHPPGDIPISYHTVGADGKLLAFRPDQLIIEGAPLGPALIAPTSAFAATSSVQALLPASLIDR